MMLRRLVSTFAILGLLAPAIAVCAGTSQPAQKTANHDCCPEDAVAEAASPAAPAMTESCCRMSDEAGRRVPSPASKALTPTQPSAVLPAWFQTVSINAPAPYITTVPPSLDHVPRHLLLSVLIV